jgi:uncharacterized membrane protein
MEFFIIIALLVIVILVLRLNNTLASRLESLESELSALRKSISDIVKSDVRKEPPVAIPEKDKPKETEKKPTPDWHSSFQVVEDRIVSKTTPVFEEQPTTREKHPLLKEISIHQTVPAPQPRLSFLERHPDLERFIGENITSKIGIGILVLAIGFFVKYAIDNQWIAETGRVAIGLLCGGILTFLAHRMRNSYPGFSSVLVGGGLAIFYFTITLAYHEYHLFSRTVTFIIMVAITGFAVVLSHLYNRQELAIIALIGGFATPFMASSGSGNYKALFIYLIILNTGLLVLAYFKAWRILNVLAFIFTVVLFASWLYTLPAEPPALTLKHALMFGSIFYLLFIVINLAHNIKENKRFLASDFLTILSNTCLYYSLGIYCLNEMDAEIYRGLFTASLALLNLVISIVLFQKRRTDPNILYLLIGITVSLVSLTAPVQLEGNNITLFWATEVVLLYWLYQKSQIKIMQLASLLVWIALLVSIFLDWIQLYDDTTAFRRIIINKGFITTVFSGIACFAVFHLRQREAGSSSNAVKYFPAANAFFLTGMLLLFAAGALELYYQLSHHLPGSDIYVLYLLAYTFAFVICFRWITSRYQPLQSNTKLALILMLAALILNLITMPLVFSIQEIMVIFSRLPGHFAAHWMAAILAGYLVYEVIRALMKAETQPSHRLFAWALCSYIVIFLSLELLLLVNMIYYTPEIGLFEIERIYVKTVLPILWGVCSFAFMWLGMKYKFRTLRIVSLSLFTVTLLKLFLFDIRHIPVAGKIAAFFCLGVLLLIISFMYQRVKKIIVEEKEA